MKPRPISQRTLSALSEHKTPPTLEAILTAAHALIADPANWIQGDYAQTPDGRPAGARWHEATRFDTIGALMMVCTYIPPEVVKALEAHMPGGLAKFNDSHTHGEVMAAWARAIADARQEQS